MRETSRRESLTDPNGNPASEAERTFDAPWQARAFAIAVATARGGEGSWEEFQKRLAAEIERTDLETVPADAGIEEGEHGEKSSEEAYYEQWLGALSRLLVESGTLTAEEIAARTQEFADGDRTAEEWVDGERDHTHGEGHAHGSDHEHAHDH